MSIVYKGRVFSVEIDRKGFPNGRDSIVEIVRHPPSVVIVPVPRAGRVLLIRQFRAAIGRELWEVPAGSLDAGETAEAAAARECEEETRFAPRTLERLASLFPAPGFCDEELIFFRASDLETPAADSTRRPDEDEDIEVREFALEEARSMVRRGEIVDLKTAYGLTLI
jgi:ADP-ribose pyrophosphatase